MATQAAAQAQAAADQATQQAMAAMAQMNTGQ
jgi:hypothetical protein